MAAVDEPQMTNCPLRFRRGARCGHHRFDPPARNTESMPAARRVLVAVLAAASPASAEPLQTSFAQLANTIPANIGIAYAPAGQNGAGTLGSLQNGVAWSSIKVPLAIAAIHANVANAKDLAARAVTASDN